MPADPPRPQLVLVHGSRLSSAQWLPQLPLLEPHVDVRLVDLPGHGPRAAVRAGVGRGLRLEHPGPVSREVVAEPAVRADQGRRR